MRDAFQDSEMDASGTALKDPHESGHELLELHMPAGVLVDHHEQIRDVV